MLKSYLPRDARADAGKKKQNCLGGKHHCHLRGKHNCHRVSWSRIFLLQTPIYGAPVPFVHKVLYRAVSLLVVVLKTLQQLNWHALDNSTFDKSSRNKSCRHLGFTILRLMLHRGGCPIDQGTHIVNSTILKGQWTRTKKWKKVSKRYPHDIHLVSAWYPQDIHMVSTWYPQDIHMVSALI